MKRALLCALMLVLLVACLKGPSAPLPTVVPKAPTRTPYPTVTPRATKTVTATPTPSPSSSPRQAASPTQIPSATPTATPSLALMQRDVYVEPDNRLSLRAEPNEAGTSLRTLPPGTHLTTIGFAYAPEADGVAWQNVQTDEGQTGWVLAQFLTDQIPVSPTPNTAPIPTKTPALVKRDMYVKPDGRLNLRAEPGATGTSLRTLPPGTHLTAIGPASTPDASGTAWQNVQTDDGSIGWVAAQFLTEQKPISPTPSPPSVAVNHDLYVNPDNRLNLRAEPSAAGTLLDTLLPGTHLIAIGPASAPDASGIVWQKVQTDDGQTGWVAAQFLIE
jgi:uncharacterized protein YgiM (DUF1202 family)